MPYIKQSERDFWDEHLEAITKRVAAPGLCTAGELNYIITKIAHAMIKSMGMNYNALNTIVGVLDSAKAEFQRRVVGSYEDQKIKENNDL